MGLISILQNIFKKKQSVTSLFPSEQYLFEFNKGDYQHLLSANKQLIHEVGHVLQLDSLTFDATISPFLEYLAKYCLFLTASRHYHHKEAGSFFYHLIETGNIAAKQAYNRPDLMENIRLEERNIYETINPMAAWLLGILHDIAKPLTDFDILLYGADRKPINVKSPWRPDEQTLHDYIVEYRGKYYQILYNTDKTYFSHEQQQMLYLNKFLSFFPSESQYKIRLKDLLPAALVSSHPLSDLVKEADRKSTKLDTLRYKPYPVIKDWAKAFLDELQLFDRIKREDLSSSLPYFFSPIGIHVVYPNGFRRLLNFVQQRYQDVTGPNMPSDPDSWVILLGTEHSVLVPNHASTSYHSPKFEDIGHFVYNVFYEDEDGRHEERVITISYEAIYLDKDQKKFQRDVKFSTSEKNLKGKSAQTKTKPHKKPKKVVPSDKAPKPIEIPHADDEHHIQMDITEAEILSHKDDSAPITAFSPSVIEELNEHSRLSDTEQKRFSHLPNSEKTSITHKINYAKSKSSKELLQNTSVDEKTTYDSIEKVNEFTPFCPVLNESIHETEYAIHELSSQIPEKHIINQLVNSLDGFEKEYSIICWLLFIYNDINQYSINSIKGSDTNFAFNENGFVVNNAYLKDVITAYGVKYELSNAVLLAIKHAIKDFNKNTLLFNQIFSSIEGRNLVFTQNVTKAMLYRYKEDLTPLLQSGEITFGAVYER